MYLRLFLLLLRITVRFICSFDAGCWRWFLLYRLLNIFINRAYFYSIKKWLFGNKKTSVKCGFYGFINNNRKVLGCFTILDGFGLYFLRVWELLYHQADRCSYRYTFSCGETNLYSKFKQILHLEYFQVRITSWIEIPPNFQAYVKLSLWRNGLGTPANAYRQCLQ